MSKDRPTVGTDGIALPILPPERDARVWARMVRVMFYTPGFLALLLLKTGEPASFGITVELLMLASAAAVVAGLFIGTQFDRRRRRSLVEDRHVVRIAGARVARRRAVPVRHSVAVPRDREAAPCCMPRRPAQWMSRSALSELLPMVAILPFMLYQLAGFGTLHFRGSEARELGDQHRAYSR